LRANLLSTNVPNAWLGTLATNAAILLCGMGTGALVARLLAPEGRGALATLLFWPQLLASIGLLSLTEGIVYRHGQTTSDERIFATTAAGLGFALATVTGAAGFFVVPHLLGSDRLDLVPLARAYFLAFLPCNFISLVLFALDQSKMRFLRYNLLRLLPPYIYLASLLFFWASGATSVATVLWGGWLGTLITPLAQLVLARTDFSAAFCQHEARGILGISYRFHLAYLLSLLASRLDQMIVLGFWDDRTIGYYVVALTVAGTGVAVLTNTFHIILFPRIAGERSSVEQVRLLARGLRHSNLLIGSTSLALIFVTPWLVPLLFGQAFTPATLPAIILLLAGWPLAARQIITRSLRALGESRPSLIAEAWALGIFATVAGPLSSICDVAGVALTSLVANSAALVYLVLVLRRRFALRLADLHGFNRETVSELWRSGLRSLRGPVSSPDSRGRIDVVALPSLRSPSR
jgi:O-antigen/teichoic acid export membrane protein